MRRYNEGSCRVGKAIQIHRSVGASWHGHRAGTQACAVNCVIMQNTGAGMHSAHSSFCDAVNDGTFCLIGPRVEHD